MKPRLLILQPTPYCNIGCSYCYLGSRDNHMLMPRDVLQAVAEKILRRLPPGSETSVVWHAGEPLAAPRRWYEVAYSVLGAAGATSLRYALQTNGVALSEEWIELFREHQTEISISIDGPERFHDMRRRTRSGGPTWALAMRGLHLLQKHGMAPHVICVLHPTSLTRAPEYFDFLRANGITSVSFSIDEREGDNSSSSFNGVKHKDPMVGFLGELLERAYAENYPLSIKEVERVSAVMAGLARCHNEQVIPWESIVVAANGDFSTFSPEFMEAKSEEFGNFVLGNITVDDPADVVSAPHFVRLAEQVAEGVALCRRTCRYFEVCGGGSPVNWYCEHRALTGGETDFCRLGTQASADALLGFLQRRQSAVKAVPAQLVPGGR